jgi:hypothetical protein
MTRLVTFCCVTAALAAGCRGRSDLVEAELRTKDRMLRCLQEDNQRLGSLTEAFANTVANQPLCPPGRGQVQSRVADIQVGRGTGGLDEDKCQGDEGLMVVIVPRDSDGTAIKADGSARINALQITPEGLKSPLSTWDVTPGNLRRNWKSGLLSTGYFVALPWQVIPMTEKLRIVVQFQTPDGAVFEAERDIQVRLPHAPQGDPLQRPPTFPTPVEGGPLPLPTPLPGPSISQKPAVGLMPPVPQPPVILGPPS